MNYCAFSDIFKNLRKNSGMTQEELGNCVGLSKAVVSKYENGMGYPTLDMLLKIAQHFGVTTDYLLGSEKGRTLDLSELTDSQAEAVQRIVLEFIKLNRISSAAELSNK